MNTPELKLFSDPHVLRQVGRPLLTELFERFTHFLPSKYFLPNPRPDNDAYFDSLAHILERASELPDALAHALLEVEALAAPGNRTRPHAAAGTDAEETEPVPLAQAIRAWLRSPPEKRVSLASIEGEGRGKEASEVLATTDPPEPPSTEAPPSSGYPASSIRHPESPPTVAPVTQPPATQALPTEAPSTSPFLSPEPPAWPEPVDLKVLLDRLVELLKRFIILPTWAAETLALWIVHTYAFHLRDVTTYIGIESPEPRCGKTTLLSLLNELANRAVASSNISPPAFFRVIEDLSPTLLIDEVDTFLAGNDQLKGILNAGYHKKTAFVLRAAPAPASSAEADAEASASPGVVKRYSCWCPKVLAKIGRFPDTLADRCIIIRMHRKTSKEQCERSRDLDPAPLKRQCLRFVADHASVIASAKPQIPSELNDRAADIWEPLLVLADLAGSDWPELARQAAVALSASAQEHNPIGSLLFAIFALFSTHKTDRLFTRDLVQGLNSFPEQPWAELRQGKAISDIWLSQRLRPYGIKPRTLWSGEYSAKGYAREDFMDVFRRYIAKPDIDSLVGQPPPDAPPAIEPAKNDQPPPPA